MVLLKEMRNAMLDLPTLILPLMPAEEIADSPDAVMVCKTRESNAMELPTVPKLVHSTALLLPLPLVVFKLAMLSTLILPTSLLHKPSGWNLRLANFV